MMNPINHLHFFSYLRGQKKLIVTAGITSVLCFVALKFCFPMPDFFVDSYTYVIASIYNKDVSYRPLGYSRFLQLTHLVSVSANFAVLIQYLLFVLSTLFCFFTVDYLFGLPERYKKVILLLILANPILILQTNLISSDTLFCSLTVMWFSICLWTIKKHNFLILLMQAACIYLCYQTRYTAVFYPIITIVIYLLSPGKIVYKAIGIAAVIAVIVFSMERQKNINEKYFATRVAAGFSGWQIANNVLCYYNKVNVDPYDLPNQECRLINDFVKNGIYRLYKEDYVGTQYLWEATSPLKLYLFTRINFTNNSYFLEWTAASKELGDYGWAIIKKDPLAYVKYFMVPNLKNLLFPYPEVLLNYNNYDTKIENQAMTWFDFDTNVLSCRYPALQKILVAPFQYLSFFLNIVNVGVLLFFLIRHVKKTNRMTKETQKLMIAWAVFYFGYIAFSLFATVVLLRYLDPLFILGVVMPFVLIGQYNRVSKEIV